MNYQEDNPQLIAYLRAVQANDPNANHLREIWMTGVREQLHNVRAHVDIAKDEVPPAATFKRGEKRKLYEELKRMYREAVQLSKDISNVKKIMREMK